MFSLKYLIKLFLIRKKNRHLQMGDVAFTHHPDMDDMAVKVLMTSFMKIYLLYNYYSNNL